ncbi:MAG: UPF0149 family protein [Pseudomonadota bacterium]
MSDSVHSEDYLLLERLLARVDASVSAAEADGRLLSLAAMLGQEALPVWSQSLLNASAVSDGVVQDELATLALRRLQPLVNGDALPALALPSEDDDLRDRVDGLAAWVTGFLGGLGEGAGLRGSQARQRLTEAPLAELLEDLQEMTRASVDADELAEDPESFEQAYTELVEFLRVATQLTFEELTGVREPKEAPGIH